MRLAEAGIAELLKAVDTLLVIPNQNLFRVVKEKTTFAVKWGACPHQLCRLPQAYRWGDLRRAGGELRWSVAERIRHLQV
jgi:hypothetical protein